ncbi:cell division protein FtsA, partial [candidate division WOR-3 bacterium]|nr:cell division protein FtsA [candidate division WOR-3 bacterium]
MVARDREIVVGLDVGTTKIAAVISRISSNGEVNIIGVGTSPSRGLKNGTVVNMDETVMSIQKAMEEAERIAGVQVRNVVTGISGEHIRTIEANGVIAVSSESGEISKEDVERAMENAKEITLTTGRLLHEIPKEFIVDHQPGIKNPVGMFGKRLELRANLIVGDVNAVNNIVRCVERAGYGVSDVVLQSLASSYSVLEPDEKDLGVILMDIGGGTTDIALFLNGTLNRNFIVPLGGENITSDLAKGLKTSREVAEK